MNPQPSWSELTDYYTGSYDPYDPDHGVNSGDDATIAAALDTGKLRHIEIPKDKKLLDVGCGAGSFLRLAKRLGALEQGVEPSAHGAAVAQSYGLNVFHGTLEQFAMDTSHKFDLITANHVIEHVPNPIETLATMKCLLAPGGKIWISVPNAAYPLARALEGHWHSSDLPFHLMHFSPSTMRLAGEKAGLRVIRQTTESLPKAVAQSIRQYLRRRWLIPVRFSEHLGIVDRFAWRYAERMDAMCNGEAILTDFAP